VRGPSVALFHDAIALQLPEYSPRSTVARFPSYLQALLRFDGVAAVSEASRASLEGYWSWLGVAKHPPVAAIPLGIDAPPARHDAQPAGGDPLILCVGSLEGRKNHAALLEACEALWSRGLRFRLRLVGMANSETGAGALAAVARIKAAGRPIEYAGPVAESELERAYAECAFTVYPSLAEGFGMPVAESLVRGKPCLCRMEGALGEVAAGGGCAGLGEASAREIADAVSGLLDSPRERARLAGEASARRFTGWDRYAADLRSWIGTLAPTPRNRGF
jgi:glycosyltransferase involved in cell wall biosynthesis